MSLGVRLAQAVEARISPFGFRYSRKTHALLRATPHGFEQLLWTSYPTETSGHSGQRYSLVAGVRHDSVEDAVNRLGLVYGAENQRATTTVSCVLEYFPIVPGKSYSLFIQNNASDAEVYAAAAEISQILRDELIPFFERYAELLRCADDLSEDPMAVSHHLFNNYENRMYRAIAASCISGRSTFSEQMEYWQSVYESVLPKTIHAKVAGRLGALAGSICGS